MFKGIFHRSRFPLFLFVLSGILFSGIIRYPFFQDDFFALQTSRVYTPNDVFRLIGIQDGTVYWRPIGIQLYFALLQAINIGSPLGFHLAAFFFHLINIYLVFKLTKLVIPKTSVNRLTAFFYAISPLHYFALGWAINFSYVIVVTLALLVFIFAISNRLILSGIAMVLALAANELAISVPILLVLLLIKLNGRKFLSQKRLLKFIAAAFAVTVGYLIWRLSQGMRTENDYTISLVAPILSMRWYGLWMIGLSDIIRDQMASIFTFQTLFTMSFPWVVFVYTFHIGVMLLVISGMLVEAVRSKRWLTERLFQIGWIVVGLSPVLLFPVHLYSHYAALASIGLYWAISQFLVELKTSYNLRVRQSMAGLWLLVAVVTLRLNYLASWMSDHARHSQLFQGELLRQYKQVDSSATIYIVTNSTKAPLVLAKGYALNYLYGVSPEKVHYTKSAKAYLFPIGNIDSDITEQEARELLAIDGVIFDL